jgi:hypothetical protein
MSRTPRQRDGLPLQGPGSQSAPELTGARQLSALGPMGVQFFWRGYISRHRSEIPGDYVGFGYGHHAVSQRETPRRCRPSTDAGHQGILPLLYPSLSSPFIRPLVYLPFTLGCRILLMNILAFTKLFVYPHHSANGSRAWLG